MATYSAPGVNEATGFISLLGVAYALGRLTKSEKEAMPKNVVFVLFDAVSTFYLMNNACVDSEHRFGFFGLFSVVGVTNICSWQYTYREEFCACGL